MVDLEEILEDTAVKLLRIAATELPAEYLEAITRRRDSATGDVARAQLVNIVENANIARVKSKPMCQDTGVVAFMCQVGDGFPLRSKVTDVLIRATRRATKEVPLRPNAVDLFEGNTGDNVGRNGYVPIIYYDLVPGDHLELVAMPKGGGSTNVAALRMLKPGLGWQGVKRFVVEALANAGSLGCPPYFIGIGIGAGEDVCMVLAKKALLQPFGVRHTNPQLAAIEEQLLQRVNELGIGVMGLGEGPTALDLHIEVAARHPASLPVGVVISCWALRHAKATIDRYGQVEYETMG